MLGEWNCWSVKAKGKKVQSREKLVGSWKRAAEISELPPTSTLISSVSVFICIQKINNIISSSPLAAPLVTLLYSSMVADSSSNCSNPMFLSCVHYACGSDLRNMALLLQWKSDFLFTSLLNSQGIATI